MAFLDLNRGIYIEGNDWCADHQRTDLFDYFSTEYINPGQNSEVNRLEADQNCRLGEHNFGYTTGNDAANRPDRLRPLDDAEQILTCNVGYARGIFNNGGGAYRTYAQSLSFVSINNNYGFDRATFLQGVITELAGYQGTLTGQVLNNMTGEPVADAVVSISECDHQCITDRNGRFSISRIPIGDITVNVHARGYTPAESIEVSFEGRRQTEIEVRMLHPEIDLDSYQLELEVDLDHQYNYPVNVVNAGDGPLAISTRLRGIRMEGQVWDQMFGFDAGDLTGDSFLQAAIFFQDHYWIAGGGGGNDQPNILYKFNIEGELVDQWEQGTETDFGWRDLTTDGEYIYGVEGGQVTQIDPETGCATDVHFSSMVNPTTAISWDAASQLFWVSGPSTNILGIDRQGTYRRVISNRNRFDTIRGLAFNSNDADGYPLYVICTDRRQVPMIVKLNIATQDTMHVTYLDVDIDEQPGGGEISTELYPFTCTLVMQMQGPSDWLRSFEAGSNFLWIEVNPGQMEVEPGSSSDMLLTLDATGMVINETYTAHIMIEHNTIIEGAIWLDVDMIVRHPEGITEDAETPYQFGLSSPYPNPFNSSTVIEFTIDQLSDVNLAVFDMNGRLMSGLLNSQLTTGNYSIPVEALDWPAGIYLVRLTDGNRVDLRKIALVK